MNKKKQFGISINLPVLFVLGYFFLIGYMFFQEVSRETLKDKQKILRMENENLKLKLALRNKTGE